MSELRVGIGVDAHAFSAGAKLVLGGVELEGDGLAGHSDGDVLAHALIDALLGAANLGDIGSLFPSGGAARRRASRRSSSCATRTAACAPRATSSSTPTASWSASSPRIADHRVEMARRLADALEVEPSRIAVRATTTDRLGFTGRGEGLAAQAVALLVADEARSLRRPSRSDRAA